MSDTKYAQTVIKTAETMINENGHIETSLVRNGLRTNLDILFLKDIYKAFHHKAYDPRVVRVLSNYTPRNGKWANTNVDGKVLWVGAQMMVAKIMQDKWSQFFIFNIDDICHDYALVISSMLMVEPEDVDVTHLRKLHDLGYLPLEIRAIDEGEFVNYNIPTLSVENTHLDFPWLPNMNETIISNELWPTMTSATTSASFFKLFYGWHITAGIPEWLVPFIGHDFSLRGLMGGTVESAAGLSGIGHLLGGLQGTDTIPGVLTAMKYYGADIRSKNIGNSVNATEHSVECSWEQHNEGKALEHHLTKVAPKGILSKVLDTWSLENAVKNHIFKLKDIIMVREGKLVIRPDSGVPLHILCGYRIKELEAKHFGTGETLDDGFMSSEDIFDELIGEKIEVVKYHDKFFKIVMAEKFGETVIEKGEELTEFYALGLIRTLWDEFGGYIISGTKGEFKMLDDHIGTIYGDSITRQLAQEIGDRLMEMGFAPQSVMGIGSYSYQYVTRDTHGTAIKATNITRRTQTKIPESDLHGKAQYEEGLEEVGIQKDPETDSGLKKSARGRTLVTKVVNDREGYDFVMEDQVSEDVFRSEANELKPIWVDGRFVKAHKFENLRDKVRTELIRQAKFEHGVA